MPAQQIADDLVGGAALEVGRKFNGSAKTISTASVTEYLCLRSMR